MTSTTHEELLGDAPIDPKFRAVMNDLAADLDTLFNPGQDAERMVGFVLLAFPLEGCEGLVNYISNAKRADVVTMLREQLARFEGQSERRWRHVTSGMSVTEIGRGRMQTAEPIGDMTPVVIYHHAGEQGGGTFWVRPVGEFEDGRFVEPPPPLAETEEGEAARDRAAYPA
jgi:hypothetical protein